MYVIPWYHINLWTAVQTHDGDDVIQQYDVLRSSLQYAAVTATTIAAAVNRKISYIYYFNAAVYYTAALVV